ncbi:MAG: hypothetical protein IEMM0008_0871 [bacterium]|nr:MAG: hypothetical protein IEMM0008_0871 [bacterium]
MSIISMKDLLEAGVHFGHQAKRWDPRMEPFIYTERNGIHIIDLQKTVEKGEIAYNFVRDRVADGGKILFVGTKKQAQNSVVGEAQRCGQYYVSHRWLGGMLTNFSTIKRSILRLKKLEKMEVDGTFESLTKKERLKLGKQRDKLEKVMGGIKDMNGLPDMVFIIDPNKEHIAVSEARKMNIPVVAVVDSNCNPHIIDYPIPGNDDAIRAIGLFMRVIADAVVEGETISGKVMAEVISEEAKSKKEEKAEVKAEKLEVTDKATTEKPEAKEVKEAKGKVKEEKEKAEVKAEKLEATDKVAAEKPEAKEVKEAKGKVKEEKEKAEVKAEKLEATDKVAAEKPEAKEVKKAKEKVKEEEKPVASAPKTDDKKKTDEAVVEKVKE